MFADVFLPVGTRQHIPEACKTPSCHSNTTLAMPLFCNSTKLSIVKSLSYTFNEDLKMYIYITWHFIIPVSKSHGLCVGPLKNIFVLLVWEPQPKMFLWSQTHQADKEGIIHPGNVFKRKKGFVIDWFTSQMCMTSPQPRAGKTKFTLFKLYNFTYPDTFQL